MLRRVRESAHRMVVLFTGDVELAPRADTGQERQHDQRQQRPSPNALPASSYVDDHAGKLNGCGK